MSDKRGTLGPTGRFPEGHLGPDDEGEIQIGVAADAEARVVRVEFGAPVAWLALDPNTAFALGKSLIEHAAAVLWGTAGRPATVEVTIGHGLVEIRFAGPVDKGDAP